MQKVLLGYSRSKGVIKDNGLAFDNVNLYVGDIDEGKFDEGGCVGIAPYSDPIKIKFDSFKQITGITFEEFCERFADDFQFKPVQDYYGLNRYKRPILMSLSFVTYLDEEEDE